MAMNLTTQASLLATIKDVMSYKGSKTTYQEILDLTDMVKGDIWGCTEVGHLGFFLYNGINWELFGSDSTKAVTLDSEQAITGLKTFDTTPIITNEAKSELEATNLKSVNTVVNNSVGWLIPDGDWTSMYMKWSTDGDRYGGGTLSDVLFLTKEIDVSQSLYVNGQEENVLIPLIYNAGLSNGKLGGPYPGIVVLMPFSMIKPYALPGVDLKMSNMINRPPSSYNQICVDFYKDFPIAVTTDYSIDDVKTWLANKGIANYILIKAYVNNVYAGSNLRFIASTAFWRFTSQSSIFGRGSATVVDMYIEKVGKVPCPIYDITYSPNCWYNSLDYNTVTTLVEMNYTKSDGTQVDVVTSAASKSLRTGNQYQLRMGAGDGVFTPPLISMKDSPLAPDYVTLNTEQTIVGNKFFQVDENADQFVRFYPKPSPINGFNCIGHLSGNFLAGDTNMQRLNIGIPTDNSVGFTSFDGNTRGGVYFEEPNETSGFGVNLNTQITSTTGSNFYGSGFSRIIGPSSQGSAFIGVGTITDTSTYGAFIATSEKLYISLTEDTSTLEINDKAKLEFQRALEIPNTTNLAKLDQSNTFTGENVFTGSVGIQNFIPLTNPTVANPKEWATLVDNDIPTKKQIVDNIQVDTTNFAKLNEANVFDNTVDFMSQAYFSNALQIKDTTTVTELTIEPAANSIIISLSDSATLTLNDRMISELKRILGIS